MQIDKKNYNPDLHTVYKALCVKQPFADYLTQVDWEDGEGNYHAKKSIEVRSRKTNYRGDILICSSAKPEVIGRMSGVTCGMVEIYDIKRVEDFTPEDWENTCIPQDKRPKTGWGWLVRNPRRCVEMDVKGQLGIYDLIMPKDDLTFYPLALQMTEEDWKLFNERVNQMRNERTESK